MKYLILAVFTLAPVLAYTQTENINDIRRIIESAQYNIAGEPVICKKTLPEFYYQRGFEPAWTNEDNITELIEQIKLADAEGLHKEDYHYEYLKENYSDLSSVTPEMDILLTDAWLLFASHLLSGKVNPETIVPDWRVNRREIDLIASLSEALENISVARTLTQLKPTYKTYVRLKQALKMYRDIQAAGGWEMIPGSESIKPQTPDPRVPAIRKRLAATGLLATAEGDTALLYDPVLKEAVMLFQKRHGLNPDGVIGPATLRMMNTPVEKRIQQIILNMERCRWLPLDMGQHYILVNIANYELEVVRNKAVEMEMSVVVGKPYRKTPVFSSRLMYLVFNPYWTVPPTILNNDVIPAIKKNPDYLRRNNMKLLSGGNEVDPATIDWSQVKPGKFPWQVRQEPGPDNALGAVKFMFPNAYNVYIHDTNKKELFSQTDRAFSSGCIRLSRPLDLAEYLLKDHPQNWTRERIGQVISKEKNHTVMLMQEVNVHIQYWTAFVDESNLLHFRNDVYERDDALWNAMQQAPPSI